MELFTKIVNDFQLLTICAKSFLHLRCLTGFWIRLWWLHHWPFLTKKYVSFLNTSYLNQHSIDFWINMDGNKYKWTQKLENVNIFIKYTLQYIYIILLFEIYFALPSKKTAQQNSTMSCTTKCTTYCTIKLLKNWFFFVFWFC